MTQYESILKDIAKIRRIYESNAYEKSDLHFLVDLLGNGFGDYYSAVPAIYLKGLKRIEAIANFENLLIKDGVVGLISFFSKFQTPPNDFKTKMYIPLKFSFLVPLSWRSKIVHFEYYFKNKENREKLFVYGSVGKFLNDTNSFKKKMKEITDSNKYKEIDVVLKTPLKLEGIDFDEVYGLGEVLNSIIDLGLNVKFRNAYDFNLANPSEYDLLQFDYENIIYFTSSFEEQLYQNGLVNILNSDLENEKIQLSNYHGLSIFNAKVDYANEDLASKIYSKVFNSEYDLHEIEVARLALKISLEKK